MSSSTINHRPLAIILSNTAAQLVAKFVGVVLTFVTTILIVRRGGPELFGDLTKVLSLVAIGFTTIDFGLNAEAVRSMKDGASSQKTELQKVVGTRLLLSIVAIGVLNGIVNMLPGGYTPQVKSVFLVGSLAIIFQGIFVSYNAWFQRRLAYWRTSIATIVGTGMGTLLIYLVIRYSPTLLNLIIASSVGYIALAACSYLLGPRLSFWSIVHRPLTITSTLRRSLPLGLILVFSIFASKIDQIILGVFRSSSEVGQYGLAYRIFDVALVLPVFVMNSVYPLLVGAKTRVKENLIRTSSLTLLAISLSGILVIWVCAPFIGLIRGDIELAVTALRALAVGLPLFYLTSPLMWQLIDAHLEKYVVWVYGIAAVANGTLNLVFTPRFGIVSSALLTGLTEAIILAGLLVVKKRRYGTT